MKDEEKTKEQLTNELKKMRQQVAELEVLKSERKHAEEAILDTEEELQAIFDSVRDGIVVLDRTGKVIKVNKRIVEVGEYTEEEIVGKRIKLLKMFPPQGISKMLSVFTKIISGQQVPPYEVEVYTKHGEKKNVEIHSSLLRKSGKVMGVVTIMRDVTERKLAEEALQKSEKRFRDITENALEWIWECDTNGKYTYASPVVEKILGYKPEEVLEKHFYDLFHPEDRQELKKAAFEVFAKKQPFREFINRNVHKDGKTVWLSTSGVPILDEKGNLLGYRGADIDISEHKQMDAALKQSEERYRTLVEESFDGIFVQKGSKIIFTNQRLNEMLGYDEGELLGLDHWLVYHPDYQKLTRERAQARMQGEKVTSQYEVKLQRKDGSWFYGEINARVISFEGEPGIQVWVRDITEHKQADETLRNSEEKYRTILESIEDGYFEVDIAGNFTFFNNSMCKILGYSRDEMMGMNNREYMDQENAKKVYKKYNRVYKTGIPSKLHDWELIKKDGTKRFVETSVSLIKNSEGHPTGFRGILRDVTERKQTEDSLKESEERFRILVEGSPLGISLIGKDGYYKYINPRFVEMFGYCLEDIPTGREWFRKAFPDEEYRHQVISTWKTDLEKLKQGEFRAQIFNVTCKDGSEKIIYFRPVTMETGDQFLIYEDITEHKQAEAELRESEERYRALVESSTDAILVMDNERRIVSCDRAFLDLFGYEKNKVEGRSIRIIHQSDESFRSFGEIAYPVIDKLSSFRTEWDFVHKDGTIFSVETVTSAIKSPNGSIGGYVAIIRDITERKQAEAELIQTRNFLQNIFDSSTDGITTTDLHGNVMYTSPRLKDILGYNQEEIIGKKIYSLYGNGKEDAKTIMKEITEKGELRDHEMKLIRKDGELIDINLSASLLIDEKGEVIGTLGIYRDITEKKKLEAQLQYAQRIESIGTLAGGIAHNFNNLLMGIQGNASLMLLETDSDHPNYERLNNIEKLIQSGSKLTSQLLGYARGGRYEVKPISFNQIVKETSDTFDITKKDITVHQDLDKDLFGIIADQGQIEQVLLNLYVNSADAMPQGGDLFLKTMNVTHEDMKNKPYTPRPGNYALLTVRDTGVGMDKKTLERIFDPFFTTKGLARGTGLGLASVYGIIKAHGGYIDVDSKKGHGTTFHVYLPAIEAKSMAQRAESTEQEEMTLGKETILLVDDEEIIIDVGSQILEKLGYQVLVARSGKEAIKFYKANKDKIDMVILDMIMPEVGGGETYDRMKEINPKIKVLLSSGYSINGQATEILERGCSGFIQKPFSIKELSQSIRKILDS